jgi:hypothetical protein
MIARGAGTDALPAIAAVSATPPKQLTEIVSSAHLVQQSGWLPLAQAKQRPAIRAKQGAWPCSLLLGEAGNRRVRLAVS